MSITARAHFNPPPSTPFTLFSERSERVGAQNGDEFTG